MLFKALLVSTSVLCSLASTNSSHTDPTLCPSPTGFANNVIRAPLPNSPKLQVKPSIVNEHNLFYYSDQNTAISEAAFASFCLDQCIAYQPNPNATDLASGAGGFLPLSYVTNKPGPCLSFTVDLGKVYPPNPNDTTPRWFCEGFDKYLEEDLSDFEPVDAPGSFLYYFAVNRACGGIYRAF